MYSGTAIVGSIGPACNFVTRAALVVPASAVPRWLWMWATAAIVYAGCKWLTWTCRTVRTSPRIRAVAYWLAWPGMDADAFLSAKRFPRPVPVFEWSTAFSRTAGGIALVYEVAPRLMTHHPLVAGWVGIVGLVLTLHFGTFHLLSCAYRTAGIDARPLMERPSTSRRLSEFWGQRWNTAFRDLTYRFLFRPLTRRFGPARAMWIGFLVSGLVHDLVITVPAGGGYGGPTTFFLIQAVGIGFERSTVGRRLKLGTGIRGRLFTAVILVGPIGLLFPRPFVTGVVVPFMHAVGAIP